MFPIQATVTLNNAAQLQAFNAFITGGGATVAAETVKPTAEKDPKTKKPDATTASSPSGAEPQASAEPAQETAPADAPTRTIDEAKSLTMKIVADKGRDAAVELLKKYGVPVAAKLAADQIAAFCADADAVLAS